MPNFNQYARSDQLTPHPGLTRIACLMQLLGDPQETLACLHIGGTNGKGSVCAYLDAILRAAGHRVGKFTSPNLVRVNERIVVDNTPISDADLDRLLAYIEPFSHKTKEITGEMPTQFEIWTAVGFLYFYEQKCEYVVLEVGMGGEFDATNVLSHTLVSVLTRIDLDHTAFLGDTPQQIARTKCGIFKKNTVYGVVSAPQTQEVEMVIREMASCVGNSLTFAVPQAPVAFEDIYEWVSHPLYGRVRPGLGGVHQIENAAVAMAVAEKMGVDAASVCRGISQAKHRGRLELLASDPILLYDGGHNPNGIQAMLASLDRYYPGRKRVYIFACMKDKDIRNTLSYLKREGDLYRFTTVLGNPRAMEAEALCRVAREVGIEGTSYPCLADAIGAGFVEGCVHIICGSLYLYQDLPQKYQNEKTQGSDAGGSGNCIICH